MMNPSILGHPHLLGNKGRSQGATELIAPEFLFQNGEADGFWGYKNQEFYQCWARIWRMFMDLGLGLLGKLMEKYYHITDATP
jgi:hypothetical protein